MPKIIKTADGGFTYEAVVSKHGTQRYFNIPRELHVGLDDRYKVTVERMDNEAKTQNEAH